MSVPQPRELPPANPTILPIAGRPHKGFRRAAIFLLGTVLAFVPPLAAQSQAPQVVGPSPKPLVTPFDVVSIAAAGAVYLAPSVFHLDGPASTCAPCDPAGVPGFDRWAIHPVETGWSNASTGLLFGMTGFLAWDLWRRGPDGFRHAVAAAQAASWAVATAEILKVIVNRKRPVFYTDQAAAAQSDPENRWSFPSGHTTAAFAVATSYFLARLDLGGNHHAGRVARWVMLGAAAAVGAMRVAAGKHFPSDVVGGAALGVTSAVVVHAIRF